MRTPALSEPDTRPTTRATALREQTSWIDVTAATVVAVVVAVVTPVVSSIHPLIPVAISPALTTLITVSVRRLLTADGRTSEEPSTSPSARRPTPPSLLHGGIAIALIAAVLGFAAALVLVTALDLVRGRPIDETTLVGERIPVPDVAGGPGSRAVAALRAAGLDPERERDFSDDVPQFRVIRTDPEAGTSVRKGSTVAVVISMGSPPRPSPTPLPTDDVELPGVVGRPLAEVTDELGRLEVRTNLVEVPGSEEPGIVRGMTPAPGTHVPPGSEVTLTVTALTVPTVSGSTASEAHNALETAGFRPINSVEEPSEAVAAGVVIATDPAAGQQVLERQIAIKVSSGPSSGPPPDLSEP